MPETRMIEHVGCIPSKLESEPLAKVERLTQREVHVREARPAHRIPARIAERALIGNDKGTSIEPCLIVVNRCRCRGGLLTSGIGVSSDDARFKRIGDNIWVP